MKLNPTFQDIIDCPHARFIGFPLKDSFEKLEQKLNREVPKFIKEYIDYLGNFLFYPPNIKAPFLYPLGIGHGVNVYNSLLYFNYPNNPTNPESHFVFAYEFNGEDDWVYAINENGEVLGMKNGFAFYEYRNKDHYKKGVWRKKYASLEEFWEKKVGEFVWWKSES